MMQLNRYYILFAVLAVLIVSTPALAQAVIAQQPSPLQQAAIGVWPTQQDCETASGKNCVLNQCVGDIHNANISVCDVGWQPKTTNEAQQSAQGQR